LLLNSFIVLVVEMFDCMDNDFSMLFKCDFQSYFFIMVLLLLFMFKGHANC